MDTFSWDAWDVDAIIESGGGFYTWAGNNSAIYTLTALGIAVFVLAMVHIIRSEDKHLNSAAADLASAGAASDPAPAADVSSGGE